MYKLKLIILFTFIGTLASTNVSYAQKRAKAKTITVTATVVDPAGNPVKDVKIYAQEGKLISTTDAFGKFTIESMLNEELLVEAAIFDNVIVKAADVNNSRITLMQPEFHLGEKEKVSVAFGKMEKRKVTGAVTEVNVRELENNYSAWNYASMLKAEGFGLVGSRNVRGLGYAIVIDGLVRDGSSSVSLLSDLMNSSEIENITILKDVTSRLLYGSLADAGVILIETRRGEPLKREIRINYESSAGYSLGYPQYLDGADYMFLYNEALRNDGLTARYTDEQIQLTKEGVDPIRYPSHNYFSNEFLGKIKPQHHLSAELSGGNKTAQYYLNFGWYNTNSVLAMGKADNQSTNRFNVRGAIDVKVNDFIKVNVGALAFFNAYHGANYSGQNFWNVATSERPNAYPFLIPIDRIISTDASLIEDAYAQKSVIDNKYLLGGTSQFTQNIYGDLLLGGYNNTIDRNSQLNLGLDFNLDKMLRGLTLKSYFGFDNYNAYRISQNNSYAVYEPTFSNDNDSISVKIIGVNNFVGSQNIGGVNFYRRVGWSNTLHYSNVFDDVHDLDITVMSLLSSYKQNNFTYTEKAMNSGFRANYMYDRRYVLEVDGAFVASPRFTKEKRWGFAPAVGAAWILSEEKFLQDVNKLDYLKLKTSWGNTKTDLVDALEDYYLYQNVYTLGNNFNYGDGLGQNVILNVQTGNQQISWVERSEINAGFEMSLFNRMLFLEANYFNSMRFNEIQKRTNTYPQFMGGGSFIAFENFAKRKHQGVEADLRFSKQMGDFRFGANFNMIYLVPKRVLIDELDYGVGYEYRQRQGKASDSMWGLVADGFYTQDEIDRINDPNDKTIAKPTFGTVQAGDIKYTDLDGDWIIDENDVKMIGNTQARFNYGLRLTLDYKRFSLFVFGAAETGYYRFNNSAYDWVYGENKYPKHIANRWAFDPDLGVDTRETATYPRLTTKNNPNNFRNSTFWITSRDYFSIPAVQLSYKLPDSWVKSLALKDCMVYGRVDNLMMLSKDEYATLNVGSAPQLRMFNFGLKAGF